MRAHDVAVMAMAGGRGCSRTYGLATATRDGRYDTRAIAAGRTVTGIGAGVHKHGDEYGNGRPVGRARGRPRAGEEEERLQRSNENQSQRKLSGGKQKQAVGWCKLLYKRLSEGRKGQIFTQQKGATVRHTGGRCEENSNGHRDARVHGDANGNGRPVRRVRGYPRPPESGGRRSETYKDPTRTKSKVSYRVVNKS